MKNKYESGDTTTNSAQVLRQRAEEAVRKKAAGDQENGDNLTAAEARQMLHELQVHQIELEMQNDELRRTQMDLDEARARYFDLYDMAPVGYCVVSDQGMILETNLTAATMLGVPRGELTKQPISRFIHQEDQDIYYLSMKQLFLSGERQECELQMTRKNGTSFGAHLMSTAAQAADGAATGWIVLSDITQRQQADQAVKENEEKYRLLMTQMKQGLAVYQVVLDDSGQVFDYSFLTVNESFERLTGLKYENIIGKSIREIQPEIKSEWIAQYGRVAMTGETMQYENYSPEVEKYFEVVVYSPRYQQFAMIISDITERKTLAIALAKEKKLLETTMISVGDGVISTDNQGNIVFLNRAAEAMTGWTQEAARGKPFDEVVNIVDELTREKSENIIKEMLAGGTADNLANYNILIAKNGVERPIENSGAPITYDNGKIVGVVLVFRDIFEKKQKQKEIEYLSYHDQLTGLYNRRFYEEELKRVDTDRNLPLTIAMGDVNGLKLINDSFGHVVGDQLLQKVAEVIKKGCRADDIIARLGGDEFVIILPKTDAREAEEVIKRIKELSANEKIGAIDLSISFGHKTKNFEADSIQDIFKNTEDHMYRQKLNESSSIRSKTIDVIMKTLFENNQRVMLHSQRVSEICVEIGTEMNFNKEAIDQIRIAGLMHDIGKIGIDEEVLKKPQEFDHAEWDEIKRHSEIGYRILSSVNEFSEIADFVLEHHENWNGKGYPRGLKGEKISLQARIIAVADAYDAMKTERIYSKAFDEEDTINEIRRCAGEQFDPEIVQVFIKQVLGVEPIAASMR